MAFANISFENPGAVFGSADDWTLSAVGTAESFASYDTSPEAFEDFEDGWGNDTFLTDLLPANLVQANYTGPPTNPFENFENGWTPPGTPIP